MWWLVTQSVKSSLRKGQGVPHSIRMVGFLAVGYSTYLYIYNSGPSINARAADAKFHTGAYASLHLHEEVPAVKF